MPFELKLIKVTPGTHASVAQVKQSMETVKKRQVTYSEVLDELVKTWHEREAETARAEPGERKAG